MGGSRILGDRSASKSKKLDVFGELLLTAAMIGHFSKRLMHLAGAMVILAGECGAARPDPTCPTQANDAEYAYKDPVLVQPNPKLSTLLAPDAVVALQSASFEPQLQQTSGAISLEAPLKVSFDAGTRVGFRPINGDLMPCVFWGIQAYQPPVDEDGRPFPLICFADSDSDGSYETLRMFAYKAQTGKGIIEAKIKPLKLLPDTRPVSDKAYVAVYRRLRVSTVDGNRAVFVFEVGSTVASPYGPQQPDYRPEGQPVPVPLKEGLVEVSGVPLNFARVADQWVATPAGKGRPWIGLECERSRIKVTPHD